MIQWASYQLVDYLGSMEGYNNLLLLKDMETQLSNSLQPIDRDQYLEQVHSLMNYKSLRTNQIIQIDQENKLKNGQKLHTSTQPSQLFFQFTDAQCMPSNSQAIIFLKQNYQSLSKLQQSNQVSFYIKQILLKYYTNQPNCNPQNNSQSLQKTQKPQKTPLSILIQPQKITLFRYNQSSVVSLFKDNPLFPLNTDQKLAVLQRRIWIEVNKKTNKVTLHTGDIQDVQTKTTLKLSEPLVSSFKVHNHDWKHCQKTYHEVIQSRDCPKGQLQNPLFRLTHFKIFMKFQPGQQKQEQQFKQISNPLKQMSVKSLRVQTNRTPRLKQNASILEPKVASLQTMPNEIRSLYGRLKCLNLINLCGQKSDLNCECSQELIQSSIHHSLVTPSQLLGKQSAPIGILNHILKVKTDVQYRNFIDSDLDSKSPQKMYSNITKDRIGYIRFKIFQPKGCYPGSPAVLQIWPPFYCSPIHNHSQAFGIAKVLMGEVRVQNFEELSFQPQKQPYMKSNYSKGQYTWLSQNSFGIHRVMNLHNQTAMTLQGYYDHKEGSDEYFSFIMQNSEHKQNDFAVYYPQNDWENYLHKKSIQKEADIKFIDRVIEYHKLEDKQTGQIDCSFSRFLKIMARQYNSVNELLDSFRD